MQKAFYRVGPGVTLAPPRFNHNSPGIIGGGMLADAFIKPQIDFWYDSLPPDIPRWGYNKRFMRDNYTRVLHVRFVQDYLPRGSRRSIAPAVIAGVSRSRA